MNIEEKETGKDIAKKVWTAVKMINAADLLMNHNHYYDWFDKREYKLGRDNFITHICELNKVKRTGVIKILKGEI